MSDWRPIETAPKDGTPVRIGWIVNGILEHMERAIWKRGAWRERHGDPQAILTEPTHWQPDRGSDHAGQ